MCGIAGFVDFSPAAALAAEHGASAADGEVLRRMDEALAERGPDGHGRTLLNENTALVGLVHRRLAIIDLSEGGHQPMATPDRTSWITYNGEIYNYRALRDALVSTGPP